MSKHVKSGLGIMTNVVLNKQSVIHLVNVELSASVSHHRS